MWPWPQLYHILFIHTLHPTLVRPCLYVLVVTKVLRTISAHISTIHLPRKTHFQSSPFMFFWTSSEMNWKYSCFYISPAVSILSITTFRSGVYRRVSPLWEAACLGQCLAQHLCGVDQPPNPVGQQH